MNNAYKFNISLSILNHLGKNLYRSLITVLGEAISNSWDADAKNVHIYIDKDKSQLIIQDDGLGMTSDDFQNHFLKIGYSKRINDNNKSQGGRPYIGRKGIGKLALLSCAQKLTIITRTSSSEITGGIIDNSGLDKAITNDVSSNDYDLDNLSEDVKIKWSSITSGTVIIFENIKDGIKNRIEYIQQLVALYFRFSLFDPSFKIFINDIEILLNDLDPFIQKTQFLWTINKRRSPDLFEKKIKDSEKLRKSAPLNTDKLDLSGFIASVEKPSELKIRSADEKITVDLYVNGRMREKDILRHIPTSRIVENYLYGQIHFDCLDDKIDRFTSSREGIVPEDLKFKELLQILKNDILPKIIENWDEWRREIKEDGDPENSNIPKKQRKAEELYNAVTDDYVNFDKNANDSQKKKINSWINDLKSDAVFNYESYGECFVAENLLRKLIVDQKKPIPEPIKNKISQWKDGFEKKKQKANLSIQIQENKSDLFYCGMDDLTLLADDECDKQVKSTLRRDCIEYTPLRDAVAHTSRLTEVAKRRLSSCFENIKARIQQILKSV
ncbi:MAG: ATP-binding protein [Fibrobacteraceae bacterium]